MCGRYTLALKPHVLQKALRVAEVPEVEPRYNIAPSQLILAIRERASGADDAADGPGPASASAGPAREAWLGRWGLVPFWARDAAIGNKMINARAESVAEKPAFRHALKKRRCVVPADGYYEWQASPSGKGPKQPYYFYPAAGAGAAVDPEAPLFLFAGLWETWKSPEGTRLETVCLLTTRANPTVAAVHDRMPVLLSPADAGLWLASGREMSAAELARLTEPAPPDWLALRPVSRAVSRPQLDGPELIAAISLADGAPSAPFPAKPARAGGAGLEQATLF